MQGDLFVAPGAERGAILSPDEVHRYLLWRGGRDLQRTLWIMLNPSKADAEDDDPTIRKNLGFGEHWRSGVGEFRIHAPATYVANLFSYRATDPHDLRVRWRNGGMGAIIGPEAVQHLHDAIAHPQTETVVLAWGNLPKAFVPWSKEVTEHVRRVRSHLPVPAVCLGFTQEGFPRHPLMPGYVTPVEPVGGPVVAGG